MRQNLLQKRFNQTLYPWIIWALSSSFLFYKYLLEVSPSVMASELMQDFSLSGASLGNLAAFYFYAYLLMQLPGGLLLDYFNPKRLIVTAITLCAAGALLFSQASTFSEAAFGRLLIGVGGAFSAVGTMKLITLYFAPKRFALLAGMMMSVGMLGAVGGEAPLAAAINAFGWHVTIYRAAWVGLGLALAFTLIVRVNRSTYQANPTHSIKSFWYGLGIIVKNPQAWLVSIYSGLAFMPITAFAGLWGVPYLMEAYGLSKPIIAASVSMVFIGFAVGAPFSGWLSDRILRRKIIMVFGSGMALVCMSVVLYVPHLSLTLLSTMLFLFGFFSSFFFVSFALMREINPSQYSGTAIGWINMFNAMCGAFSEPLIGKLLDEGWQGTIRNGARVFSLLDYRLSLLVLPICLIIALVLLCFIKETYCRSTGIE